MRFCKRRAFYVRTKKRKSNQIEHEETPDSIIFEWQLKYNSEVEAKILEFGEEVEVLTPQWFREKIRNNWKNAAFR
jgi:predicted DNA-binding transcriptional regulator YafY